MMIYVKSFFTSRIKNNTYVVLFYTYERIKIIKNIYILHVHDTHTNMNRVEIGKIRGRPYFI